MRRLQFDDAGAIGAASNLRNLRVATAQGSDDGGGGPVGHRLFAAGKDVRRRIAQLRPGMDGDMGLGDGQDSSYPLGAELVKGLPNHLGVHCNGSAEQLRSDVAQVVKQAGVAISKFQQYVRT